MPTSWYSVRSVHPRQTHQPGVCRYEVVTPEEIFSTVNQWIASICERASATEQRVKLAWRDTRYGPEIVFAELEPQPVSIAEVVERH